MAEKNHTTWDEDLLHVVASLNSVVNDTTSFPPAKLIFGRMPRNCFEVIAQAQDGNCEEFDPVEYNKKLQGDLGKVFERVKESVTKAKKAQQKLYNLKRRDHRYQVGDLVYRKNFVKSSAVQSFAAKLAPKFLGPYRVKSVESNSQVILETLNGKDTGRWHVSQLRPVIR